MNEMRVFEASEQGKVEILERLYENLDNRESFLNIENLNIAIRNNDTNVVYFFIYRDNKMSEEEIMRKNMFINHNIDNLCNSLEIACEYSSYEVVKLITTDINYRCKNYEKCLLRNNEAIFGFILKNEKYPLNKRREMLKFASERGLTNMLRMMYFYGFDDTEKNIFLLTLSIKNTNKELFNFLISDEMTEIAKSVAIRHGTYDNLFTIS